MAQYEQAPENFLETFNFACRIALRATLVAGVALLALFFYGRFDSFAAFFVTLILAGLAYGLWRLVKALVIGPPDPDADD